MSLPTLHPPFDHTSVGEVIEEFRVVAKITRTLIPFQSLLYVPGHLNWISVGLAGLAMTADLGLSKCVKGWTNEK